MTTNLKTRRVLAARAFINRYGWQALAGAIYNPVLKEYEPARHTPPSIGDHGLEVPGQ